MRFYVISTTQAVFEVCPVKGHADAQEKSTTESSTLFLCSEQTALLTYLHDKRSNLFCLFPKAEKERAGVERTY